MKKTFALMLALLALATAARAEVKMPAIFGDHMVLQRGVKAPVWGTAEAGEQITVSFADQKITTQTGSDGQWQVALAPLAASREPRTLTVAGKNTLQFQDVLVGEVWICSGQSNMVWAAGMAYGIPNGPAEIAAAQYPQMRMITIPAVTATEPQASFDGTLTPKVAYDGAWAACTPEVMKMFSAVSYFFGRKLHQDLDVPVGLIGAYWSGTPAQPWTSREALAADKQLQVYLQRWEEYTAKYPEEKAKYEAKVDAAKAKGQTLNGWFNPEPQDPVTGPGRPASLFNAMIHPLIPYAIRGAIWYQGESNSGTIEEAKLYSRLFPAMITDWRNRWELGDFPFLFVQLCTINKRQTEPVEAASGVAQLRESQLKTLAVPNTGMAVIIDTDATGNLHPPDKKPVGERLALAALKIAYDKDLVYSGPVFEKMEARDGTLALSFKHLGGGLVTKPEGELKGFAVAGKDRKFVWADAKIEGDQVVVASPQVPGPVAVRYGWATNPEANLFNKAGLPATPFRTDTWDLKDAKAKPKKGPAKPANQGQQKAPAAGK